MTMIEIFNLKNPINKVSCNLTKFCNDILDKFYEDEIEVYDALNQINQFMKENKWR